MLKLGKRIRIGMLFCTALAKKEVAHDSYGINQESGAGFGHQEIGHKPYSKGYRVGNSFLTYTYHQNFDWEY